MSFEKTLVMIKPDALSEANAGRIISGFEDAGFRIMGARMIKLSLTQAQEFYSEHREKDFYGELTEFITSNPMIALAVGGESAVTGVRRLMGSTDPAEADEGTLRKKYALSKRFNAVHGSDSPTSARRELEFFFPGGDGIFNWDKREYR